MHLIRFPLGRPAKDIESRLSPVLRLLTKQLRQSDESLLILQQNTSSVAFPVSVSIIPKSLRAETNSVPVHNVAFGRK